MINKSEGTGPRPCWFVGASHKSVDQTKRFFNDGIWEYTEDKFRNEVKDIQTGDRIAIKSVYTRKQGLPFDNRGEWVSVMAIKAIGVVKKNHGDGQNLDVEWTTPNPFDPRKEWYFYTGIPAVWCVTPGKDWAAEALIDFTFEGKAQNIKRFEDRKKSENRNATDTDVQSKDLDDEPKGKVAIAPIESYSVDNIISDGCFIEKPKLESILKRLQDKKNLILQGPPGTGKTWLAKRLAFALIGQMNDSKVRAVQFHPNLSYEDFVRGWRPSGDGKLTLVDGPFVEMIRAAENERSTSHVIVIEEINRGNPAQIFGEMLTLLEFDKRAPNEALELSYRREDDERVFIPDNLYVIGTMNIADRSLALVDLALRRRFAFIDLKPSLGERWKYCLEDCGIDAGIVDEIRSKILSLNKEIEDDSSLGEQFSIGHSYVTPPSDDTIENAREWFRQVVETEIGPLLDEYWFDSRDKANKAKERLLEGF